MRGAKALRALVPALAALIALAFASTAQADYEQVGLFGQSGAGEQLIGSTGTAVNTTGAGGVEPGSFYVSAGNHVSRYNAKGEIEEVWGWNTIASGPDKTTGFERCRPANGDICAPQTGRSIHEEGVGYFYSTNGVAVDQSTGYVYVANQFQPPAANQPPQYVRDHNLIEVFSADGSEVIARFGDAPAEGETIETSPEKVAQTVSIAVDEDGTVYLGAEGTTGYPNRVMCFQPENGDFEHYAYCGRSQDTETNELGPLALDDAGHLYLANTEFIQELSSAASTAPLCTYVTHGQLFAMTVNPITGEVFYFNGTDRTIHRLKPCDPAKGKFEEAQARVKISPIETFGPNIRGLAFNPTLSWGPNRPPGVLYGAAAASFESSGVHYNGLGYIFAPAKVLSPAVISESVSNTRTASTVLHASINPNGFGTHYVFQYLSAAQYESNPVGERFAGATEAPLGGGEVGGGSIGEAVVSIAGLTPDTAYRFRVIATSECNGGGGVPCVSEGEAFSFATYPLFPPGLPDHRAYEMVSPAQKHGAEVVPAEPNVGSCLTTFGTSECKPNTFQQAFPMQSSPDGESLAYEGQPFNPFEGAVDYDSYVARRTASGWQSTALIPAQPPEGVSQVGFDAGLDQGLLAFPSESSEHRASLVLQPTAQPGSLRPLLSEAPPNRVTGLGLSYGGHSADFSRIYFAANDTLTEATPFAPEPPDPGVSKYDLYEWHEGQLTVVNVAPGNATVMSGAEFASTSPDTNAVSADGSRVFFKDEAGNLYVREQGEVTRQINDPGHFLSASPDASEVLLSDGCLYSLESEACTDLTEGQGGFKGMLGQSRDLSHIYFVDTAVLAENEGAGLDSKGDPQVAEAGKSNLYSWGGGEARFIAQLDPNDNVPLGTDRSLNDWDPNPAKRTAEASPSGRFLAFGSVAELSGHDNVGRCELAVIPESNGELELVAGPCNEAFLYDSATEELTCASCNPTGEAPLGNTTLRRIYFGQREQLPQPRYLTDEGRLYFDTQDSLSARDTNEGVEDVYEFAPQGTGAQGTCEREAGCAFLISAGTEAVDSNLIAVDETGKNVFFDTRDKLALKDKDELLDVYDAREGGGIAAETEISRAECQGENCQAPVSPPNDQTPASSTFEGAGNVKEAPAAKKHTKKKKHAKKHKKKAKKHARTAKRNHGGAK